MPRLILTFREVVEILLRHGFTLERHHGTSHRQFRGVVRGHVHKVTIAGKPSDEVSPGTLSSIIRQSGLPKKAFRD